jgi:hypothetical protein
VHSIQFDAKPNEVDHWTPESSWCAGCWAWIVDCEHLAEQLQAEHHAVDDACIRSLAYHRATQCLEVRFRWKSVQQFRPVSLHDARTIWKSRPMNTALSEMVKNNRYIRWGEVRTEGKLVASLLRGWAMIAPLHAPPA